MADTKRVVSYGDKRFELDAGMTLEQAKEIMARHFPELADPSIETKKEDGTTVYIFSKKAGRKGSGQKVAAGRSAGLRRTTRGLLKAKPFPVPDAMAAGPLAIYQPMGYQPSGAKWPAVGEVTIEQIDAQIDEGRQVEDIRQALLSAPSAMPIDGSVLL